MKFCITFFPSRAFILARLDYYFQKVALYGASNLRHSTIIAYKRSEIIMRERVFLFPFRFHVKKKKTKRSQSFHKISLISYIRAVAPTVSIPIILGQFPGAKINYDEFNRTTVFSLSSPTLFLFATPSAYAGYMNANSPRVGYYACTLSSLCGAALLFLVGWGRQPASPLLPGPRLSSLGVVPPPPPCACPPPPRPRLPKSQSLHVPLDVEDNIPRERDYMAERMHEPDHYCHPQFHAPLRPSKSVPEGLGHQDPYRMRPRRHRDITVIEQITTSV